MLRAVRRLPLLVVLLGALLLPGTAAADDTHMVKTLVTWSKRIMADAQAQGRLARSGSKPAALRVATQRVLTDSVGARRALAVEHPSSANGRRCRTIAAEAFDNFATAERELLLALAAGVHGDAAGASRHSSLAQKAADRGSKLLAAAGKLGDKL